MEPTALAVRPNRMLADTFADTDAIRTLGSANAAHAADLADVAALLASLPPPNLGPVGTRFQSALIEAAAEGARAVTAVSERLAAAHTTAYAAAAAYDDADAGARDRITGV